MTRATYVPPSGSPLTATYIIVGEQPGRMEVIKGYPFCGPSGLELESCLHSAGISRSDCYFTNVIKDVDRPIGFYIEFGKKGPVISPEGQQYINELARELSRCTSKIIIALGNVALFALTDRTGVTKWRGSILDATLLQDKKVIPSIHPATIIHPKNVYKNKRLLIYDLKRARNLSENGYHPTERTITIRPTFTMCLQFLSTCEHYGLLGNTIFYDIEVDIYNGEMTCISFAYTPTDVISIPFICEHGDYFTVDQEIEILKRIARILENEDIPIGGQNLCFDSHYMLRKYGIRVRNMHDTMVAQKTLLPDYPVGLHFICSLYTDLPYYKDDGKYWLKGIGNFEGGWRYNALDSVVCAEAHPKQLQELFKQQNYYAYLRKCKTIPAYVYIMEKGIKINVASMQQAYDEMGHEMDDTLKALHKKVDFPLNPNSPKQVADYFYVKKRLPAYKSRTGGDTTDEKALKRIARKGYVEASLILKLRGLGKERATFLDTAKVDSDGRMRCSYNVVGTRFSRVSSSENIFGTGNNLQNQPHRVLNHFLADSNYVFYGMDLSQAENRIVAYVGRITPMIEAFERGDDIHGLTARIMMNIFYGPEKSAHMDVRDLAPIGDGRKTWRDWGKKCVVGSTEILTPNGWIPISEWNYKKEEIAQWNPKNHEITFTSATNLSVYQSDVIELGGRNSHVIGTPNHKVPIFRKDKRLFKVVDLKDIKPDAHYGIPTCGMFGYNEGIMTPDEVKLLVAFQADGSYNHKSHRFKFNKDRKINRIKNILTSLRIPFSESIQEDCSTLISFKGPAWLTKEFSRNLLFLGLDGMKTFMNELGHWDGYIADNIRQYFSTNKSNVEWAQTLAHLCGYTAIIEKRKPTGFGINPLYVLHYNNRNKYATLVSQGKRYIEGPVTVYGPEVPTGFFLIRSNGKISVTGNSNHGLNYDLGFKTFSLYNEIMDRDGKIIVDIYHRAYPGVRNGFHSYIKSCINKDRTLTNLMGRKTLFTDRLDDALYKDAYACIPQGTVGDIIDQRGINYTYYNTDPLFRYVELLIQVHDQIGFQIPTPHHPTTPVSWDEHSRILHMIKKSLEIPLYTHYKLKFTIPVDTSMSLTLNKDAGENLKKSEDYSPANLARAYAKLMTRFRVPMIIR